jgi:hypothetical protein
VTPIKAVAPQPAQASECSIGHDQHHHRHDRNGDHSVDDSGIVVAVMVGRILEKVARGAALIYS